MASPENTRLPPVTSIGPWRLTGLIGSGGISDVWSAVRDDGATAAVKLLREPERSNGGIQRFLREGRFLTMLSVDGLPRCMQFGENPVPHIVLESLRGQTLGERLDAEGALPAREVVQLAEALFDVVVHLHRNGIIHRDIKPSNLFWTEDGVLKVLDLGLARAAESTGTTTLGDVMGTWAYMAPEQLVGAEVDQRCDLFSIGVTLFELLTGSLPFQAHTPEEQLEKMRDGERESVLSLAPEAPAELARTIERLIAWDPSSRPPTAATARARILGVQEWGAMRRAGLVGRSAAIGALEATLDSRMTTVMIGGPGTGVLRMSSRAFERAVESGFDVIWVRSVGSRTGLLDQLVRQLGRFFDTVSADLESLTRSLAQLASEGPLLLIFDQMDQASPGSRADLARVLEAVGPLSVLVTAQRDCPELSGHRLELRALSTIETERLVSDLLGASGCPAGLGPILQRATNGLPGLITLAVRELVERGSLWAQGVDERGFPRWQLDRQLPVDPTIGLARLYGRSLAQLPASARRLLEAIAVAGESTALRAVLQAAGVTRSEAVPPVMDARLIYLESHTDGERVGLSQPGMGPLLLRQLSPSRTTSLHRGLAEALAGSPDAMWMDHRIRWHRAHGQASADAGHELNGLGEDLRQRGQLGAALDVLDVAVQCAHDVELLATVHLGRGKCLAEMSRWGEAVAALGMAREYAFEGEKLELEAESGIWLAEVLIAQGRIADAVEMIADVLETLSSVESARVVVHALITAAEVHRHAGDLVEANRLVRRAVAVSTLEDELSLVLWSEAANANLLVEQGRVAEGCQRMVAYADFLRFTGRTHSLVPVLYRLAVANRRNGRIDAALDALDEALDVCRYVQRPYDRAWERVGRAGVLHAIGDLAGAETALAEARVESDLDCPCNLRLAYRDVQLDLRLSKDDGASALAVAQAAEAEATQAGHASDAAFYLGMSGVLTANVEAIDQALDQLAASGDRRLATRLLLAGARLSQDAEVYGTAEREARRSGDRFLMLDVLWVGGASRHRDEAESLCRHLQPHVPRHLLPVFKAKAAVRWVQAGPLDSSDRPAPEAGIEWPGLASRSHIE